MTSVQPQRLDKTLLGVTAVVAAESMFFVAVFMAWFYLRANAPGFVPPIEKQPSIALPLINTAIAVLSAITMTWALSRIRRDDRRGLQAGLAVTITLGLLFMGLQSVEFARLGLVVSSGSYATMFIAILVFHVLRVFIGVGLMALALARAVMGHFSAEHHIAITGTAIYWYFITAVWLVVLYLLFLV
ncbi:MAG TPA: cytochrome c oxidase subunit 3 [Thermoflexales bacterium]|nr:cytochrome c oxidase subunit 3 [Thermoflexales bacterium]HQW35652.1 cytochrome c oxidase subunit 3 [Thermoflexales bacterium]HQX75254.1 cytochrome c oxidase subunit 3 [Thermoflexales bacterium]HQZ21227.1 cytochrome c oxidase subunit 3 [Thermoflexales bacterium]HQZ99339.1 cytochrome c oxidase subunit 3 [Thermoflexales bacterium]